MSIPTHLFQALTHNRMYLSFREALARRRQHHPFLSALKRVREVERLRMMILLLTFSPPL